jgi:BirA family biotin operon repressor/biotin-[acetyl-CoA-carboxylase] ligase
VSLKQVTGTTHYLKAITGELMSLLDRRYGMVVKGEGARLESEYHEALYRAGEWHRYSDNGGEFEGMIERVMPDGMLLVRRRDGSSRYYAFREIDYIL